MREARNSSSMLSLYIIISPDFHLVLGRVYVPSTSPLRVGHGLDRRVSGASWAGGEERWLYIEELLVRQE
jgi:hypothetical protein